MKTKCNILLRSFNQRPLEELTSLCKKKKSPFLEISFIRLPKKRKKITLIKSPHVHKKSREQFEAVHYSRLITLTGQTNTIDTFIKENIVNNSKSFYFKLKWQIT